MAANNSALDRVQAALADGNSGLAITEMENYLAAWPEPQTAAKLQSLKDDYDMMVGYWRQGGHDPQLEDVYRRQLQRLYVLYANVCHYHRMQAAPYLYSLYSRTRQGQHDWSLASIRHRLEDFVSSTALLQLEPDNKQQAKRAALHKTHQQQVSQLFEYVLTSRQWTDGVGVEFGEMMLSPTVDSNDQQLIISAVSLSLMNQFDMAKFRMLTDVYRRSQDDAVRQRALVGWVLAMDERYDKVFPEQRTIISQLLQSPAVCQELVELQIQLISCLSEAEDTSTIRQEIMPDLMKNSHFRMTQQGIVEDEEDPMENILNPNADEQRMEQLDQAFERMLKMQEQGADIYFGGFSQMKRFPFFYDMANWLMPFYMQHPDITQFVEKYGSNKFLQKMMEDGPFCNSDRYSFVIAFQQVFNQLPEEMRRLMERGEMPMNEQLMAEQQTRTYKRRIYLMDLYRFFRLFSHRSELQNPFNADDGQASPCEFLLSPLLSGLPIEDSKAQIVRLLKKKGMQAAADRLLLTFDAQHRDVQYYLWVRDYEAALRLDPTHRRALQGYSRQLFDRGDYSAALAVYDQLAASYPEEVSYSLNKAVCLVQLKDYEPALQLLFRLNYEHPEHDAVSRVLTWTLTCQGKLEQAAKRYEQLTAVDQPVAEDLLNQGYCYWLQGRVDQAVANFTDYCKQMKAADEHFVFTLDGEWLEERGIARSEVLMMEALVKTA